MTQIISVLFLNALIKSVSTAIVVTVSGLCSFRDGCTDNGPFNCQNKSLKSRNLVWRMLFRDGYAHNVQFNCQKFIRLK
jgi:hypothetical protein